MTSHENHHALALSWNRQYVPAVLWLVLGVFISGALFWGAYSWERNSVKRKFCSLSDDRFHAIDNVLDQFSRLLAYADNVFMVGPQADSPEFTGYVRLLKRFLEKDQAQYPSVRSLMWVPRVPRGQQAAFEQTAKDVFDPNYTIQTDAASAGSSSETTDAYPVYLTVGSPAGHDAPGKNLALDPKAWTAMSKALDTGKAIAMEPIHLSKNENDRFGYQVFQPLYRSGDPGDPAARRNACVGFLCFDLDTGFLVNRAFEALEPVGIDVLAVDVTNGWPLLLCRHASRTGSSTMGPTGKDDRGRLSVNENTEFFGRNISLRAVAMPAFWSNHLIWQPWVLLLAGLALTLAGAAYQFQVAVHSTAVEKTMSMRMEAMRREFEQESKRKQDAESAPAKSTGQTTGGSNLGAPLDASETPATPGEYWSNSSH